MQSLLKSRRSIEVAAENGCAVVGFPAISAGVYGYPLDQAARIAINTVAAAMREHPQVTHARFWLFNDAIHQHFENALAELS